MKHPLTIALLTFFGLVAVLHFILLSGELYPPDVTTAREQGFHLGNRFGVPILFITIGASYLAVRLRKKRREAAKAKLAQQR